MTVSPEQVVALLTGSATGAPASMAGGCPGQFAMPRRAIASELGVDEHNEPFRELIRAMTAAGYLRRERRGGAWVYVLGRPLDDTDRPPGPTPGFAETQTRDALADVERLRQTPQGARPGGRRYTTDGKIIHGVSMPPNGLCGRDLTGIPTDIPLYPGADLDLLNQRETQTSLLDDITCPGCVTARASQAGDAGPIHGTEHPSCALCGRSTVDMQPYVALLRAEMRATVERYTTNLAVITCSPCIVIRDAGRPVSPAPQGRRPGRIDRNAPEPFDAEAEDVVHGANRPDKTLCFVPTANMPRFDITRAAGAPSWTPNLDLMTCAACIRVGDDPMVHGLLPGVHEFTACGDVIGDLHNPADTVVDPALGATVTCYPCREEISTFKRESDRRRRAVEKRQAGITVHLAGEGAYSRFPVCPARGLNRHEAEMTVFPGEVNCPDCIAGNGGNGYRGHGYDEGRAAAAGTPDTSGPTPHNYVQGLAVARAESLARSLEVARSRYGDRCTFNGLFSSEHPYENYLEVVAESMAGNDGYDEWERCGEIRGHLLHAGEPASDEQWLARLFEFQRCLECGGDADAHQVALTAVGNRFAQCLADDSDSQPGADTMAAGPTATATDVAGARCIVSEREIGTPHGGPVRPYRSADSTARYMICDAHLPGARTRSRITPVDVAADERAAHEREDPAAWPAGQADEAEVHRRQDVELGERGMFLGRVNDAAYVRYADTVDPAGDLTNAYDLVVVGRGLPDWRPHTPRTGGWIPAEPSWTSRTFDGSPAGYRDEAEEAWRHRVERIDYWRRAGRLSDDEATVLLGAMDPGAVISEEEAFRRNGTSGRFDPAYVDAVEQLSLEAELPDGSCRYCGERLGHVIETGPDGRPRMAHPPWDTATGTGTYYGGQAAADVVNLVPGDPVATGGRYGIFEYLDESGRTAYVTFEGATDPEQVPAVALRVHTGVPA